MNSTNRSRDLQIRDFLIYLITLQILKSQFLIHAGIYLIIFWAIFELSE